ncbi:MAG TPA: TonB-dependent receptor, partial [Rhodothermales bacterium]|nr:TonB-dependent receptor [Rhodothermales bacterium]
MKSIPLLLTGLVMAAGTALAPAGVYAQTGTIYGVVTDAQSGDPLPGAAVRVTGTSLATATSLDGEYRINLVPSGNQSLEISYIGYRTEHVDVVVPQGGRIERNIEVHPEIVQGEEVVVTAQAEGQAAAINQQIASNTIVNVVSAARIQELPDANAAESVGRLPGISILRDAGEGQKVVVRGLSPKYTSITVNGVQIPATDAQNRSVNLSMISPDMLAGIEVYKALTPDQDADAIGGIVNLTLKGAPAGLHYGIDAQTGYNSQQTAFGQYKGHASVSNRFLGDRFGVLGTASLERADRGSDVFNAGYSVVREAIEGEDRAPIRVDQVALMDRLETRNRYGASIMLDYDLPHGSILMSNFGSLLKRDELRREKQYNLGQFRTWYDFRDRDVDVSILSNALRGDHTILGSNFQWQVSRSASLQNIPYYNHIRFQELGAFDDAILEDQKGPTYVPEAARNNLGETFIYDGQDTHERAWERNRAARADLKIPLAFGRHVSGYVKFGGKYRSKVRTHDEDERTERFDEGSGTNAIEIAFPERDLTLTQNGFVQIQNFLTQDYRPKNFLDGQYAFGAVLDPGMLTQFYSRLDSLYLFSPFADLQDYEYYEDIGAGYAMAELHITPRLMILPGIRYEHAWTEYNARQGYARSLESDNPEAFISDTTASNEYGLWFPMFHVRFHVTDWFDIRLARTRTLSRPDYTFLSPGRRISADAQRVERGNPFLRPAKSTNYDVFFSFYSNRIGLFTIGGFYKQLDDLVYE